MDLDFMSFGGAEGSIEKHDSLDLSCKDPFTRPSTYSDAGDSTHVLKNLNLKKKLFHL